MDRPTTRWLDLAGEPGFDDLAAALTAFSRILILHCAARLWVAAIDTGLPVVLFLALACTGAALACVRAEWLRPALWVTAGAMGFRLADTFPASANHLALEVLTAGLLAAVDLRSREGREDALLALRWVTAIVLFHTGVQKALHGTWFDGRFLGFQIASSARFSDVFALILPAEEFARLRGLDLLTPDSGPFSVRFLPFVALSNGVWLFELLAPFALLWPRTRRLATLATAAFVLGIQSGARELFFGFLFTSSVLLFWPCALHPRLVAPAALVYAALVAVRAGLLPGFFFN